MKMHRTEPTSNNQANSQTRLSEGDLDQDVVWQKKVKLTLVSLSALYALAFPFTIMPAIFSIMLGTNTRTETYIAIFSLLTFPAVLLFSIIVPWTLYFFQMYKTALILLFLPFINGALILYYVIFP